MVWSNFTNCIFLSARQLTGGLEVNPQVRKFALVEFANIFNSVNVKGYCESMDWDYYGHIASINVNLIAY